MLQFDSKKSINQLLTVKSDRKKKTLWQLLAKNGEKRMEKISEINSKQHKLKQDET
jgi:hypothetical protein